VGHKQGNQGSTRKEIRNEACTEKLGPENWSRKIKKLTEISFFIVFWCARRDSTSLPLGS
jgi:hypothetical protein